MRCLYCGKQLALFRRLTGGSEFCSEAHKHSYHEEYNRLALNRLLQAQSKGDDTKPPLPKPTNSPQPVPSNTPRDFDAGWTPPPKAEQKHLNAAPETAVAPPFDPPPEASFIVEKPGLCTPAKLEACPSMAAQVLRPADIIRPIVARHETSFVPAATSQLKYAITPAVEGSVGRMKKPVGSGACSFDAAVSSALTGLVARINGLEPADLVPLNVQPVPPALAEAALEPFVEFLFSWDHKERAEFGTDPGDLDSLESDSESVEGALESVEDDDDGRTSPPAQLEEYVTLAAPPIPPAKLAPVIINDNLMPELAPILPVNNPFPLRSRVTVGGAASSQNPRPLSAEEPVVKVKLAMAVEEPTPEETKTDPSAADVKEPSEDRPSHLNDEIPPFLKTHEDKSGKKWTFQRYLKDLVGCLMLASFFGLADPATASLAAAPNERSSYDKIGR